MQATQETTRARRGAVNLPGTPASAGSWWARRQGQRAAIRGSGALVAAGLAALALAACGDDDCGAQGDEGAREPRVPVALAFDEVVDIEAEAATYRMLERIRMEKSRSFRHCRRPTWRCPSANNSKLTCRP